MMAKEKSPAPSDKGTGADLNQKDNTNSTTPHVAQQAICGPLQAALEYAQRGWPVFPLHTPITGGCSCGRADCTNVGKHPRTKNGFKDAAIDEAKIREWWAKWPDANIGIPTGEASGLVVLDVDPRNGGEHALDDLQDENGKLPETPESLTGGGGQHILFAYPTDGVKVTGGTNKAGPGLDIKADGGYIVAPPSLHKSGRCYAWELSSHPNDVTLAPLPPWLLSKMERRQAKLRVNGNSDNRIPEGQRELTRKQI